MKHRCHKHTIINREGPPLVSVAAPSSSVAPLLNSLPRQTVEHNAVHLRFVFAFPAPCSGIRYDLSNKCPAHGCCRPYVYKCFTTPNYGPPLLSICLQPKTSSISSSAIERRACLIPRTGTISLTTTPPLTRTTKTTSSTPTPRTWQP